MLDGPKRRMRAARMLHGLTRHSRTRAWLLALGLLSSAWGCLGHSELEGPSAGPLDPPLAGIFPQYRLEPTHRGISPPGSSVGPDMRLVWKSDPLAIGDYSASKSSPAVDEDSLFVGVDDGHLYALSRQDGSVLWRYKTHRYDVEQDKEPTDSRHHGIHGTPAFDDTSVYIGDYSGYLYSLAKDTGELIWEVKLGGSIGASPVLFEDHIFIAVEYPKPDGKIFIVQASDGAVVYSTPYLGNHPHSSVTLDTERGYMFVGANNGLFFCFDFVNREEVWRYTTGAEIKSTAAVVDETVYITSWDHKLHAIDIETGDSRFAFEAESSSMSSPSSDGGRVYFGADDGYLYALDAATGSRHWAFGTEGVVSSSPTIVRQANAVVVGSKDWSVYMLDMDDGELLWAAELDGRVSSVPVVVDNALFVNDDSGTVFCYAD